MNPPNYLCPKCNKQEYELGQIRAVGGFWGKLFDVQNKKFNTVSCKNCGFTEIYKAGSNLGSNILDFLAGG